MPQNPKYLSTDPNAGLESKPKYLSTDPNAGSATEPAAAPWTWGQFGKNIASDAGGVASGLYKSARGVNDFLERLSPTNLALNAVDNGPKAAAGDYLANAQQGASTTAQAVAGLPGHYYQLATHPIDSFYNKPISTLLDVAALADPALRGVGMAADAAGLSNVARAANATRSIATAPVTLPARAAGATTKALGRGLDSASLGFTRAAYKAPLAEDAEVAFGRGQRAINPGQAETAAESYVTPRANERAAIQQAQAPVQFDPEGHDLPVLQNFIQTNKALTAAGAGPYNAGMQRLNDFLTDPNISTVTKRQVPLTGDEYQLAIRDALGPQTRQLTPDEIAQAHVQAYQQNANQPRQVDAMGRAISRNIDVPAEVPWTDADYRQAAAGRSDIPVSRTEAVRTMNQVPVPQLQATLQRMAKDVKAGGGYARLNPGIADTTDALRANAEDLRQRLADLPDAQGNPTRVRQLNAEMEPAMGLLEQLQASNPQKAMLTGSGTNTVTDALPAYGLAMLLHNPIAGIAYWAAKSALKSPSARGILGQGAWEASKAATGLGSVFGNPRLALSGNQLNAFGEADDEARQRQLQQALTSGRALP